MQPKDALALGQYIILFQQGTTQDIIESVQNNIKQQGGTIGFSYTSAVLGFSASIPDNTLQALATNQWVQTIEADGPVTIMGQTIIKSKSK